MRLADWPERLAAYVESVRHMPHDFVRFNCAQFVAGAIEAVTGEDLETVLLGHRLQSKQEALEFLARRGGDVRALARSLYGPEKPMLMARRGDVVITDGNEGESLGICMGDHVLIQTPDGLEPRGLLTCTGCWPVD